VTQSTSAAGTAAAVEPAPAEPGQGAMWVVLTATFMATLDFFIVNVAIPAIQLDLKASEATVQWIVAGYGISYGAGMITGGRLGDAFGRRKVFTVGLALFTVTSLLCGVAPNSGVLIVGRLAQGASAALCAPQVLAIVRTVYSGKAQVRAFTMYGFVMGVAAVFGQLIGGLLMRADVFGMGWRACFLINLPIGAIALLAVPRFVPESKAPVRTKLDPMGMVLITAALVALLIPLIQGREQGWPAWTWILLAAAVVLLAVFLAFERRLIGSGGAPLINPAMFHDRAFTSGLLTQLVFWMGQASYFLILALFLQYGRKLDALGAGEVFAALGLGYTVSSYYAGRIAARMGRQVLALGGLLTTVGLLLTAIVVAADGVNGSSWLLVPGLAVDGIGMGLVVAPLALTVLARVNPQYAAAASGVLTTALQVGNSLGVAIIGLVFFNVLGSHTGPSAYGHAYNMSLFYSAAIGIAVALLVQLLPKKPGQAK
jgi:EmrB/QacA subfamily drug resistance transporter